MSAAPRGFSRIAGTGSYLPQRLVTNRDLEAIVDTSDQWIVERTGIRERHIAADGNVDRAWALAAKSVASLRDLGSAVPLIRDPSQRASLYPKMELLLHGLPKGLVVEFRAHHADPFLLANQPPQS